MSHLSPEQLYSAAIDHLPLSADAKQHLAQCAACRSEYEELSILARELAVARASYVAPAILQEYAALFTRIEQQPGQLATWWRSLQAVLAWDSRQQPALMGIRSAGTAMTYRLLYTSEPAEIELMVESDGRQCTIQGEIVPNEGLRLTPALLQWFAADGTPRYETESSSGHFALPSVTPGLYRLRTEFASGDSIEIEALEIT